MTTSKLRTALAAFAGVAVLGLAACGGDDSSSSGFSDSDPSELEGTEIKVLMPYKVPEEMLTRFTDETGIDVQYNTSAWDGIASKLVVANQAGTYIADVTEFDWSFTGQFGGNGWSSRCRTSSTRSCSTTSGTRRPRSPATATSTRPVTATTSGSRCSTRRSSSRRVSTASRRRSTTSTRRSTP